MKAQLNYRKLGANNVLKLNKMENKVEGYFFESELNNQQQFLVCFEVLQEGSNVVAKIYEYDGKQGFVDLPSEVFISEYTTSLEPFCEIDIWNKYYFPKFTAETYQWYHNEDGREDFIGTCANVMKFALAKGLKIGNIKTY